MKNILYQESIVEIKHLFRMMRNTLLALFVFAGTAFATESYSQTMKVTVVADNMSTGKVISEIEKQTDYLFVYNVNEVNLKRNVKVNAQNKSVAEVLNKVFEGTDIYYAMEGKNIMLMSKAKDGEVAQQANKVTGIVKDTNGEPIIGANVTVKGQSIGTITDINGRFVLDAPKNAVLQITYIGYVSQEVKVSGNKELNVVLKEDTETLDEVVVIGYGSIKKSSLTNAVSKMNASAMKDRPMSRPESALQGQLAGVVVRSTTGEPGQDIQIRVRGAASVNANSDPLYVVDGMPMNTLAGINPSDIESMEVLKDAASAAIYGSRGSNGVVMVTTKQGRKGKASVSLNATYGVQTLEKKLDTMTLEEWMSFNVKAIDARYLAEAKRLGHVNAQISDSNEQRMLNINSDISTPNYKYILDPRWFNYLDAKTRTGHPNHLNSSESLALLDWQDEFYQPAAISEINLNVSGGSENTSYMFSGGVFNQEGLAHGTKYRRYSLRANIDSKINKYITAGMVIAPTFMQRYGAGLANGKDSQGHIVNQIAPVADADAGYGTNSEPYSAYLWAYSQMANPIKKMENLRRDDILRLMAKGYVKVTPIEKLDIELTGSVNYYDSEGMSYNYTANDINWTQGEGAYSSGGHSTGKNWNTLLQAIVNYERTFNKHTANIMLGTSSEQTNIGFNTNQTYNRPFPNDALQYTFSQATMAVGTSSVSQLTPLKLASFFGRLQYNYDNRYLFSGSLRYDGCSIFGTNNKWGVFPAFSAGWNISRETFFTNLNLHWFNNLKLRASYGATGNNAISNTAAYASLTAGSYAGYPSYYANSLGNADLGWEKTYSTDLAVDMSFLDNRIQFSFDWYTKKTTNLLYSIPSMGASGFSKVWGNMGEIKNQGFDIELNTINLAGEFKWNTSFNLSYNKNKVISLGEANTPVYSGFDGSNFSNILRVGEQAYAFYMYNATGVWKSQKEIDEYAASIGKQATDLKFENRQIYPGDLRYEDVNGDGSWDKDNDRVILGSPSPKFVYGMTNSFSYKGFDLSILLTAQTGGKIFGVLGRALDRPGMDSNCNMMDRWMNAWWSEEEPGDGTVPYILSTTTGGTVDSRWLHSSDYLRIKNVTLGYRIPVNPKLISNLRVYLSVENLLKWDNYYNGYSPESANTANTALGLDYGSYPSARTLTFGVNINF